MRKAEEGGGGESDEWGFGVLTPPPETYSVPWHHGFETNFATESATPNYNPMVWDQDWNLESTSKTANKYVMDRPLVYGEGTLVGAELPRWPFDFGTVKTKRWWVLSREIVLK